MENDNFGVENVYYNKRVLWSLERSEDNTGHKSKSWVNIPTLT